MAYDEDEFAALQEKERQTHDIERRLRITIAETKQQIERYPCLLQRGIFISAVKML